jgi:Fe-S-cluster containining protein
LVFKYTARRNDDEKLDPATIEFHGVNDFAAEEDGGHVGCSAFVLDEETGRGICLQQSDKPILCRLYPMTPKEIIFRNCGYAFEEEKQESCAK